MRAKGLRFNASAKRALVTTSAAAPSEIDDELAAVTVPSLLKAGFKAEILLMSQVEGVSSVVTTCSPLRLLTVTGVISAANAPEGGAAHH